MIHNDYQLFTPDEVAVRLASQLHRLRLERNWTQATLAKRSGVSLGSLRRFEHTGEVSLKNLLNLALALGRLSEFSSLFETEAAQTMKELEASQISGKRQRGSI